MNLRSRERECCHQAKHENSATHFLHPAPFVSECASNGTLSNKAAAVLEVGSGCLRNAFFLQRRGFRSVTVVEIPETISRFSDEYKRFRKRGGQVLHAIPTTRRFDYIVAAFVLEVICPAGWRHKILKQIVRALKPHGMLILALRGPKDIKAKDLVRCRYEREGFLTTQRTFIRKYTVSEVTAILQRFGMSSIVAHNKVNDPKIIRMIAIKQ